MKRASLPCPLWEGSRPGLLLPPRSLDKLPGRPPAPTAGATTSNEETGVVEPQNFGGWVPGSGPRDFWAGLPLQLCGPCVGGPRQPGAHVPSGEGRDFRGRARGPGHALGFQCWLQGSSSTPGGRPCLPGPTERVFGIGGPGALWGHAVPKLGGRRGARASALGSQADPCPRPGPGACTRGGWPVWGLLRLIIEKRKA